LTLLLGSLRSLLLLSSLRSLLLLSSLRSLLLLSSLRSLLLLSSLRSLLLLSSLLLVLPSLSLLGLLLRRKALLRSAQPLISPRLRDWSSGCLIRLYARPLLLQILRRRTRALRKTRRLLAEPARAHF
jgi:hypothetical protein